jgi:PAS domain S-box-containing protein
MTERPKILIVDDKVENLVVLEKIFAALDAKLIRAKSGNEALAKMLEHEFAVALIDVQMPGMDGFETVEIMRQQGDAKRQPVVIFISAIYSEDYYKIKGVETGAIDFITKPINAKILSGKVSLQLDLYKHRKSLEEANDTLELSVQERTSDLEESNRKLVIEIDGHKRAEKALQEVFEFREKIISESPVGIAIYDAKSGQCMSANKSMAECIGASQDEMLGQNFLEIKSWQQSGLLESAKSALKSSSHKELEVTVTTTFGKHCSLHCHFAPFLAGNNEYLLLTLSDITERNKAERESLKMEQQLFQAHKMEAIGTMAGGIAHDFNNLLTIIRGNVDLLQIQQHDPSRAKECFGHIQHAVTRSTDLVQQILSFSRQSEQRLEPVTLSAVINNNLKLLRSSIPTTVEILNTITEELIISADKTQLQQVLINLCTNAVHAMDEKGLLRVDLQEVELSTEDLPVGTVQLPGQYAKLSVSDTGVGMDKTTQDKIFDPFFTTKSIGEGTGMGLAVVHGIMASYDGFITVDSQSGRGTTFNLYFPSIKNLVIEEATGRKVTLPEGTERVLLVDDEEYVVAMGHEMLEHLGYTVTSVSNSIEALNIFTANPQGFDLVITDQTMPEMSGVELAAKLLKIQADIPIILCSGYSAKVSEVDFREFGLRKFCKKPMGMEDFALAVREVLDENGKST